MHSLEEIKSLFTELELTELSYKDSDFEFSIKKDAKQVLRQDMALEEESHNQEKRNNKLLVDESEKSLKDNNKLEDVSDRNLVSNTGHDLASKDDIKSPLPGVFYAGESSGAKPYISVGDRVSEGDIVCTIEAMKMFNDVKSKVSGLVTEIFVNDGDLVEYQQPLFRVSAEV